MKVRIRKMPRGRSFPRGILFFRYGKTTGPLLFKEVSRNSAFWKRKKSLDESLGSG